MLHELIYALHGVSGDIFHINVDGKYKVVKDISFLHPSEAEQLDRLCFLGQIYSELLEFISAHGKDLVLCSSGHYMHALCDGIDIVLEPYRQDLLALEHELMSNKKYTIGHVQAKLTKYYILFPALKALIQEIKETGAHGCYILDILHKGKNIGYPDIRAAIIQLHSHCHRVFYKQLVGWLLYGTLLDNHREFIIKPKPKAPAATENTDGTIATPLSDTSPLTAIALAAVQVSDKESHRGYIINAEMLPSYLPPRIVQTIIFIGEAVLIFDQDKKSLNQEFQYQRNAFSKEIEKLASEKEFNYQKFESVINTIRAAFAKNLYDCVVSSADLVGELNIIKQFYLLGRGELYLSFIDHVGTSLNMSAKSATKHFLNSAFLNAAHTVLLDEKFLQQFSLSLDAPQGETASEATTGWDRLCLDYDVQWPLHILITAPVLESYNNLFKFLLFVKRTHLALDTCWSTQMQHRHHLTVTDLQCWRLRHHMAFLVNNLQYYLQVDVIESQFSLLIDKINNTKDFEEICIAHDTFITNLLSQTFLMMKPISKSLQDLLNLCLTFCNLVKNTEPGSFTPTQRDTLEEVTVLFQRHSYMLFKMLSSVSNHQSGPHLAQLLLRIDFNKYVTNSGGQLGSYYTADDS